MQVIFEIDTITLSTFLRALRIRDLKRDISRSFATDDLIYQTRFIRYVNKSLFARVFGDWYILYFQRLSAQGFARSQW